MEKQIPTLTSELKHLKSNQNKATNSESENHSQQQNQAAPSTSSMASPHKLQILQRNEDKSSLTLKNGVNASAQNGSVKNEDLNDVIQLIQNTMQALTTFENYNKSKYANDINDFKAHI